MCRVIWPEGRQAWMYTADALRESYETLSAANTIKVSLAEMWADLDEA